MPTSGWAEGTPPHTTTPAIRREQPGRLHSLPRGPSPGWPWHPVPRGTHTGKHRGGEASWCQLSHGLRTRSFSFCIFRGQRRWVQGGEAKERKYEIKPLAVKLPLSPAAEPGLEPAAPHGRSTAPHSSVPSPGRWGRRRQRQHEVLGRDRGGAQGAGAAPAAEAVGGKIRHTGPTVDAAAAPASPQLRHRRELARSWQDQGSGLRSPRPL